MQNTPQPLVSVALCTYNGEKFLEKQLDSILLQDYGNLEIVAVDDCSADHTWNILRHYARKNERFRVYRNRRNIGYSRNFEKAIKLCKGDLIALADQDDIWIKDKISILTNSINDCVMVYHDSDFIDARDRRIDEGTMSSRYHMYDGGSCLPFILSNCVSGHAAMFRKELVKYLSPFDSRVYHDWWISYVAFNVGKVRFVDKVLVHYRQHENSLTDSLNLCDKIISTAKPHNIERISVNLDWLRNCARFKYNREPSRVTNAYNLFLDLKSGKRKFQGLLFIIKYFDLLFYICGKPRSFLSKVNFARKICFN